MKLAKSFLVLLFIGIGTQIFASESEVDFSDLESVFIKNLNYSQWIEKFGFSDPKLKVPGETNETEVLVTGGGPGGLFSALLAYEAGSKVVLIEKRPEYTREQIVNIFEKHMKTLLEYYPENEHLSKIVDKSMGHVTWVKLKNLEWMLYRILEKIAVTDPERLKILHRHELVGTTVDDRKAIVKIGSTGNKLILNPHYIVGADSYNSFVRDHFGFEYEYKRDQGLYITVVFDKPTTYYGKSISMGKDYKLVGDDTSFNFSAKLNEKASREYMDIVNRAPKYYLQDFATNYAKTQINADMQTKSLLRPFPSHANIFHVFETKTTEQMKSVEDSPNQLKVFLVGDAYRTVVYYDTGMGANNAIADAYSFLNELNYQKLVKRLPIIVPGVVWDQMMTKLFPDFDRHAIVSDEITFDDTVD